MGPLRGPVIPGPRWHPTKQKGVSSAWTQSPGQPSMRDMTVAAALGEPQRQESSHTGPGTSESMWVQLWLSAASSDGSQPVRFWGVGQNFGLEFFAVAGKGKIQAAMVGLGGPFHPMESRVGATILKFTVSVFIN